ncbi:MAG TPA: hypothetical protein PLV45_16715, partial [bacterium]|nr:hypothetical protein [bacterium]
MKNKKTHMETTNRPAQTGVSNHHTPDGTTIDQTPEGTPMIQKLFGLVLGIGFGFLLQRSGVADCDVIMGQLLLQDFTVVKVMLSAVITGLFLVNFLFARGMA